MRLPPSAQVWRGGCFPKITFLLCFSGPEQTVLQMTACLWVGQPSGLLGYRSNMCFCSPLSFLTLCGVGWGEAEIICHTPCDGMAAVYLTGGDVSWVGVCRYQMDKFLGCFAVVWACNKQYVNVQIGSFTYVTTFYKVVPASRTQMTRYVSLNTTKNYFL